MTRWSLIWMCVAGVLVLALAWGQPVVATVLLALVGVFLPVVVTCLLLTGNEQLRVIAIGAALPSLIAFVFSAVCFVIIVFEADDFARIDGAAIGLTVLLIAIPICIAIVQVFFRKSWLTELVQKGRTKSGQLSLAYLFGGITVLTIALAVVFGMPAEIGTIVLLAFGLIVPLAVLVGILRHQAEARLFWIGAATPAALLFIAICAIYVAATFDGWDDMLRSRDVRIGIRIGSILVWLLIPVTGMLAAYCARLLASHRVQRGDHFKAGSTTSERPDDPPSG